MPKPPTKKEILDGAADVIWDHVGGDGATPTAARRAANDLVEAYQESQEGRDIARADVLEDLGIKASTGRVIGEELARMALIPAMRDAKRRYGIVNLHVKMEGDELIWTVSTCDIAELQQEHVETGAPKTSLARRNPASSERYEVVDKDGRVVGHVEATWIGDAQEQAEQRFGKNVQAFVETKGRPNRVGELGWVARARRNPASCGCKAGVPVDTDCKVDVLDESGGTVWVPDLCHGARFVIRYTWNEDAGVFEPDGVLGAREGGGSHRGDMNGGFTNKKPCEATVLAGQAALDEAWRGKYGDPMDRNSVHMNPPRKPKRGAPPKGAVFQITLMRSRGHGRGVGETYTSLEEAQKNAQAMRDREVRAGKFNREHWYEITAYEPGATPDEVGAALDGPWALLGAAHGGMHWTYSPSDAEYRAAGFTRY